jgi:hypothetical protein
MQAAAGSPFDRDRGFWVEPAVTSQEIATEPNSECSERETKNLAGVLGGSNGFDFVAAYDMNPRANEVGQIFCVC